MLYLNRIQYPSNIYAIQYVNGEIKRHGPGISFWYFVPNTSLVAVPMETKDIPFVFTTTTSNFQGINIQGQITYRIEDPLKIVNFLNFNIDNNLKYNSEDPNTLPQRITNILKVMISEEIEKMPLKDSLKSKQNITKRLWEKIQENEELTTLGIKIVGFSILAITPTPETARALEAETREKIFKESDDAIYIRRNSAVDQERTIKENELQSEISIEKEKIAFQIDLEEKKKKLSELMAENKRIAADASAYGLKTTMDVLSQVNPIILQALAASNMNPAQLIAQSFQELGKNAAKIGQLNISPDLLQNLMEKPSNSQK
jgi:regulator of protease activity HflC (stomatin/prohibitin superfamily)